MSDDEDWFERALRDLGGSDDADDESGVRDGDAAGEDAADDGVDPDPIGNGVGTDDESSERDEPSTVEPSTVEPSTAEPSTAEPSDDETGDEVGPFGESVTGESDLFGGIADGDEADLFGGPVGDPGEGNEATLDDREFEAPGGGDVAFGDEGVGDGADGDESAAGVDVGSEFDEEVLDSDIDRIDVGIEGLDEMILGGIPERSLLVAIGSAGTGKTTFGLQFLTETLCEGGSAVYITLEESREAIISTAEEKGWPFREWVAENRLAVVSLDPIEMANSLASIRSDISRLVDEFGADRLVLDSVSLLEMMYDHPATRRSEVFDFARSLKGAGVTTMLTSEASEENPYASRYGIVEYLVDAVFILQYVRPSNFRETRLAVEIQKIRDANHSRETKPYEITNDGISVYRQANIF